MSTVSSLRIRALGGECELYAVAPGEPLDHTAAWIDGLHRRLTRFDRGSELARFNERAGEWIDVSPELGALLRASLDAYERSGGLVNVAILPALVAAGYDRTFAEIERDRRAPAPGPVAPLDRVLSLRGAAARLERGCAVDLGGVAKGWIADRAVERLGVNALVSCGGDLRAAGAGPDGSGWPVGFGGTTVLLEDRGAATSGTWRRAWGEGLHHLIDPRTGAPSTTDLHEVSVVAATAFDAEILAKSAILRGSAGAEAALEGRALAWALA